MLLYANLSEPGTFDNEHRPCARRLLYIRPFHWGPRGPFTGVQAAWPVQLHLLLGGCAQGPSDQVQPLWRLQFHI